MRELKVIFPPKNQVLFGEELVEIKTLKMADLPVVAEVAEKVFDKVFMLLLTDKQDQELNVLITKEIINIFKNDMPSLFILLETATTVKPEVIPDLSLEAGLFLLDNVLEVNKTFLYQNLMPMAKAFFQKYKPKEKTNG